jgi:hypothetical protein
MVTPNDIQNGPFEHLQDVYLKVFNKQVRASFREDLQDGDISTDAGSMKEACLIKDSDNAVMMLLRVNLFYLVREEGRQLHPPMYMLPMQEYQDELANKIQVILYFEESKDEARKKKRRPITQRCSFRLMKETVETLSAADVEELRREIRTTFPRTYKFRKGRIKLSYRDKANGYEMIVTPYTESEGRELITKVLSLRDKTPNWEFLTNSESGKNFAKRETVIYQGKSKKTPEKRPIGYVYLKRAELKLPGGLGSETLYETHG